jgi:hypothetical protein
MRKRGIAGAAIASIAAALIPAAPAGAITGGGADTVHTNVGLVRFTIPDVGRFRCSGTLISPTVVLTAGHCTEGPAVDVYVSFDDALQPDPLQAGIPPKEKAARAAHYITGTAHPDPSWDGQLQFSKQHDQGVVVLDALATTKWNITPAPLPPVGFLDANQGALKNETFELVGYGVNIGEKKAQEVVQFRSSTTSYLKNVGSEVVTFQINENDSKAGGGSCFGDSGGAAFLGPYVLGDASYVNSLTCNATGSYQRDDTEYSRNFLNPFLGL